MEGRQETIKSKEHVLENFTAQVQYHGVIQPHAQLSATCTQPPTTFLALLKKLLQICI